MPISERWWVLKSTNKEVRFNRVGGFDVLTMNVLGQIGVIGLNTTMWFHGNSVVNRELNGLGIYLPTLEVIVPNEMQLAVSLRTKAILLDKFSMQLNLFEGQQGTFHVVLLDAVPVVVNGEMEEHLSVTLAFGFTIDELVPEFEGGEISGLTSLLTPTVMAARVPRVSRYKRPWVI